MSLWKISCHGWSTGAGDVLPPEIRVYCNKAVLWANKPLIRPYFCGGYVKGGLVD